MPQGISKNPLTDISKVYLEQVSVDLDEKKCDCDCEKVPCVTCGEDHHKIDEDTKRTTKGRWVDKKGRSHKFAVTTHTGDEKHVGEIVKSQYPAKRVVITGQAVDKKKKAAKKKGKNVEEDFSDWRSDLSEYVGAIGSGPGLQTNPDGVGSSPDYSRHGLKTDRIKDKKVKNKIKINPSFQESAEELTKALGGHLLEVAEVVDDKEAPGGNSAADNKEERTKKKENMLKKRIIRMKMMAVNSGSDDGIIASYQPDIEGAVEYFFEEGINEEGLEQLIEDIGLDDFVDFIEGGTVELNEERAARRASVRAKSYEKVKAEVDKSDAAKKASKKGEYAPSYAKKETDVTVYDDDKPAVKKKPAAKKVAPKKPVTPTKTVAPKKPATPKKPAAPKKPVTKKVTKAVAKVKKTQPANKPSKEGLRSKIATAYKKGVERHKAAVGKAKTEVGKVVKTAKTTAKQHSQHRKDFVKGISPTAKEKKIVKGVGGAVKKALTREELELLEGRSVFKKAMGKVFNKKQEERKAEKAQDAGARAKRKLARREYASKVSGSEDNVPDDLRDHYEISELNRYGKETGKATGSLNKRAGSPVKTGGSGDKALQSVQRMIRKDYGRPEGQRKKERGKKPPVAGEYGSRRSPEQIVKKRRWDKERADASMMDTRGT